MKKEIRNLPESIRARLNNYARENQTTFNSVFYIYAFECFLHRLSVSKNCDKFVLKGGVAFIGWGIPLRRVTKDIDFQAYTENAIENIVSIIKDICLQSIETDDGMSFDEESVSGVPIRETADYQGVRIFFTGRLGVAVIHMVIDVSFGNVITPSAISVQFPTILGNPTFQLNCYPCETTIAEKFHAITDSGGYNDRFKDHYDLWVIKEEFEIRGEVLIDAIVATFTTRKSTIPSVPPTALTKRFAIEKQQSWMHFLRNNVNGNVSGLHDFEEVTEEINDFLLPLLQSIAEDREFNAKWVPRQGWLSPK